MTDEAEVQATPGTSEGGGADVRTQVLVLGGGPGGYTAAFRAADLGLQVTLVERGKPSAGSA